MEGKIAETVFTFSVEGILSRVASLAAQELSLAWGFKAELKRLGQTLLTIQEFLGAVSDQPQDRLKAVEKWVMKLKGIAHDAEDVMDEFDYEVVRRKVELRNHMKKKVLDFFSLSNPLAFRLKMAHKIQKINQSLVDLKSDASFIGLVSKKIDATPQESRRDRQTNSFFGIDEITVGRGEVVSNIVTTLTNTKTNQENLAVMPIVGMGGLGKTTLAKSVYNEDSIVKFFEKRIWVCVSDTFDVNLILLKMLEQLKPANAPSSKDNQEALLKFLKDELKDKKYLLVLDDVWNEDPRKWENLMECFSKLHFAGGSKIIVTTRSSKVASISEKLLQRHELGKLSVDECWSIMKNRVFPNSNAHIAPEFHTVGREIATNCGGVPLVAKVLGGILLNKKNIEDWLSFEKSRIWENLSKEQDRIMPVLKLSFDNLESPSLKQCFAYCSMFKKDLEIQRDNLIQLWMAQGLLHPSHGENKDEEDKGNEYFDILLQSSLFQDATMSDNGIVSKCKMHDLVHDLAKRVSISEIWTGDSDKDNTLEVRHVARVSSSMLDKIPKRSARKLRSLFFDDGEVPGNIMPRFKALRVLNLSNANIEEFPISIGRLKHLRYLDISKTRFKALPKSIGKLYNLQTLRATNCSLKEFPKELQNLINLRHIYFDMSTKFPQGIRRLTCLRTLPYFSVGNEIGHQIEELAGLKHLKGELIICNMEHVKNGEEANKAELKDKKEVCHLSFEWTINRSTTNNNEEGDVLEGLRPHHELESLCIENFMGDKFPSWMILLNNLKKIELLGCNKCEGVPSLGHLPKLTELKIRGMNNLKCVDAEFYGYDLVHNVDMPSKEKIALFPALKVLYIVKCNNLIEWMEAPMMSTQKVVVFPCLEELSIGECDDLTCIAPDVLGSCGSLKSLFIGSCKKLRHLADGLDTLPLLENLSIIRCDSLELIPITQGMASLRELVIEHCEGLSSLPSGLEYCTSLQKLSLEGCNGVTAFPFYTHASIRELTIKRSNGLSGPLGVWASLMDLTIRWCRNLTSIEIQGGVTTSLQTLQIDDCEELSSLPALPQQCPSLQRLVIIECPKVAWFGVQSSSISLQSTSDLRTMTSLRELIIIGCEGLESWVSGLQFPLSLDTLRIRDFPNLEILPSLDNLNSLRSLEIIECPKVAWFGVQSSSISLQSTSDLRTFTSLRELAIVKCEGLESWVSGLQFPLSLDTLTIFDFPNLEILPSFDNLNSLWYLEIRNWRKLKYPPTGLDNLISLRYLRIGGFWEELDSFPFPDFQVGSLMHLTSLELYGWPKLKSLPQQIQHLTSLTFLNISSFDGVETLPEWLGSLTSLTLLWIEGCKNLMNLPSVQAMQRLTKLHTLWIKECHPLLKQRWRRDSGTDWPKIYHIPHISIDGKTIQLLDGSYNGSRAWRN